MENLPAIILTVYALLAVVAVAIIIYLIVKRIEDKKRENFEKRDN